MLARGINIIIVSYFSKSKIVKLLNSIDQSIIQEFGVTIIVVNNSISQNLKELKSLHELIVLDNTENKGFGYACNQALSYCKYNYTLLLNPDTILFPTTLQKALEFIEKQSEITVLGIKHLDENNKIAFSCSRFPKLPNLLFDIVGLSKLFPKVFTPAFIMTDWSHQQSRYVDQVMGAFLLIKQSFVQQFGLMDDRFFVFLEDTDLCKKVWDNNGKVFYNADIEVIHEGGNSTDSVNDKKLCYMLEGKLKYANKYFSKAQYYVLFAFISIVEPLTRMSFAIINKPASIKQIFSAYKLFYQRRNFK